MSLLPSSGSSVDNSQDGEIQILNVENTDTEAVFDVLGSSTSGELVQAIYDSPGIPSELAERLHFEEENRDKLG